VVIKKLSKSGHSVVVAIPRVMIDRLWLQPGDYLKIEDVVEGILIRPLEPRAGAKAGVGLAPAKAKAAVALAKAKK
jgi:antitoxin component of MazEF toxin-antitoxin module